MADYDADRNQRYMAEMLITALRNPQARGLPRADLAGADILMACTTFAKRLDLIVRGLS